MTSDEPTQGAEMLEQITVKLGCNCELEPDCPQCEGWGFNESSMPWRQFDPLLISADWENAEDIAQHVAEPLVAKVNELLAERARNRQKLELYDRMVEALENSTQSLSAFLCLADDNSKLRKRIKANSEVLTQARALQEGGEQNISG